FAPRPFDSWAPATWRPAASPPTPVWQPRGAELPDRDERPAKRARSEKYPSPPPPRGATEAPLYRMDPAGIPDSMKTDAELLLNFARPGHFAPRPPPPSLGQPSPTAHEDAPRWRSDLMSRAGALPSAPEAGYGIPPSRI